MKKYILVSDSGRMWVCRGNLNQAVQFWADVSGERVSAYRCILVKVAGPKIEVPYGISRKERKRFVAVSYLKDKLDAAEMKFRALPESEDRSLLVKELKCLRRRLNRLEGGKVYTGT